MPILSAWVNRLLWTDDQTVFLADSLHLSAQVEAGLGKGFHVLRRTGAFGVRGNGGVDVFYKFENSAGWKHSSAHVAAHWRTANEVCGDKLMRCCGPMIKPPVRN